MDELLAAIQQLGSFLSGGSGGMGVGSGIASSNPAFNVAGAGGGGAGGMGWVQALINLLLSGSTAYGAGQYGSQTLNNQKQLYDQQQQAIRMALGLRTGNLAQQAANNAMPLDRRLAYIVSQAADQGTAQRGMSQSPGAVAAGEATALAPYAEQNLQLGAGLAQAGNQLALEKLGIPFAGSPPDYLSVLDQLSKLGFNSAGTYGLPSGAPGTA